MDYSTAFYRREAQAEEKVLNWFRAAGLWRQAIAAYPSDPKVSALARTDIDNMQRRAESCDRSHKQLGTFDMGKEV